MLGKLSKIQQIHYLWIIATAVILLVNMVANLNLVIQACLNIIPIILSILYLKELNHNPTYEKEALKIANTGLTVISLMLVAKPAEKLLILFSMNFFWVKAILTFLLVAIYIRLVRGSFRNLKIKL